MKLPLADRLYLVKLTEMLSDEMLDDALLILKAEKEKRQNDAR